MKLLLISYGFLELDGRLRNLISVFRQMGELSTFTRGEKSVTQRSVVCNSSYPLFIIRAVNYARKLGKIDVLILDNRKATIPGLLTHTELKYLISQSHIGIVNYGQTDTNSKYCASGKLYEFLYEGIPVVTTSNSPLKRICDEEKIGVVDDRFADGINEVLRNYEFYKERVKAYTERVTVEDNNRKLICEIENILGKLN